MRLKWGSLCFLSVIFQVQAQQFSVFNKLDVKRTDELIVLKRADIEKAFPEALLFRKLSIREADAKVTVLQLDDLDFDGKWDEAVFLCDLDARSKKAFTFMDLDANAMHMYPRAHVRLRKKANPNGFGKPLLSETMPSQNPPTDFSKTPLPLYLTEGPAWENDKIAFRMYFDTRNGKDIFGKLTAKMMMDTVGSAATDNYHKLSDWGMDILHAGNSLGAGSLAFGLKVNGRDSIVRLGGNDITKQTYTRIADGPYRATFRMEYEWRFFGKPVKVSEEISIWGGQYFYDSSVTITGTPPKTVLYSGIANFYDNDFRTFSWGGKQLLFSFGNQSELRDGLTMAIAVPKSGFTDVRVSPAEQKGARGYKQEIFDSYLLGQEIMNGTASFRFYAFWEHANSKSNELNLELEAEKYGNPVVIDWKN